MVFLFYQLFTIEVAFATSGGLCPPKVALATEGGEGGIRTLDTSLSSYNGLANRPFRPLRHLSVLGLTLNAKSLTPLSAVSRKKREKADIV
jgi:hypothetical protein